MTKETSRRGLAPIAAALSLIACYSSLAALALPGALGVGIALSEAVWAGTIVLFAALAGVALIGFAMSVSYSLPAELAGFALLWAGTYVDWRGLRA